MPHRTYTPISLFGLFVLRLPASDFFPTACVRVMPSPASHLAPIVYFDLRRGGHLYIILYATPVLHNKQLPVVIVLRVRLRRVEPAVRWWATAGDRATLTVGMGRDPRCAPQDRLRPSPLACACDGPSPPLRFFFLFSSLGPGWRAGARPTPRARAEAERVAMAACAIAGRAICVRDAAAWARGARSVPHGLSAGCV
ncbi:hypothetical protein PHLGIDRAFT_366281 [Phlebiopsis gigantea 11061_1 CR5-6]|uniref:Uncharacterized protein n=1 Tax=Phlebiopsis gigantea (strain 11061_1 CR5-6) TaxID=745531 RepID=A0A0C3PP63_PHLG1|nr:hypothetical protein PHLGIDRAFT_366281 [Phlebiopsis gigantea 11061_1 CR5-6]